jgi:hypothetical protein
MSSRFLEPPQPPRVEDQQRVGEAGRRRSVLEGTWETLLRAHLVQQLGRKRSRMVGLPDISSNLLKQVVVQVARLYAKEPIVGNPDRAGLEVLQKQLEAAKVWGLAQRNQRLSLAVNESVMFLGFREDAEGNGTGTLTADVVPSDFVWGEEHPQDPGQFGCLYRARRREVLSGTDGVRREVWTWDVWDVRPSDPDAPADAPEAQRPSFRILSEDRRQDLTRQFVDPEEWRGEAYPYRLEDGVAVIPAVLYHSEPHSGLWNPWANSEVVFGTLQDALNWTNTNHAFMRASWAQRYIGGGSVRGTVTKTAGGEKVAVATEDPATATQIRSDGDGSLVIGQWGAAVDIDKAERFARNYGLRLSVHFGLSPSDVSFETRGPASGVALTVSREGLRSVQGQFAPLFRSADLMLLERASAVLAAHGISVPESGYTIEYAAVELSPGEKKERLANLREELEMGLTTKVHAVMELNPGISEREARRLLREVNREIEREAAGEEPLQAPESTEVVETDSDITFTEERSQGAPGAYEEVIEETVEETEG